MSHSDIFTRLRVDFFNASYSVVTYTINISVLQCVAVCCRVLHKYFWSCDIYRVCHNWIRRVTYEWVMSHTNAPCHTQTAASEAIIVWHDCVCDMTHLYVTRLIQLSMRSEDMTRLYLTWFVCIWHDSSVRDTSRIIKNDRVTRSLECF